MEKTLKSGMTITSTCAYTGKKMRLYLRTVENHPDNEPFKKLIDNIEELEKDFILCQFEKNVVSGSVIQKGKGHIYREHNSLQITFGNDTFLRISPYKNGLEISKVMVHQALRGKGLGEYMMFGFFLMCIKVGINLGETPIMLECTGQTGITKTDLQVQLKFFRKFGFRVDQKESRYEDNYVQMNLQPEKFVEWFVQKTENSLESKFSLTS